MLMIVFCIFICMFTAFSLYVYRLVPLDMFYECLVHIILIFTHSVLFWSEKENINKHDCTAKVYIVGCCFHPSGANPAFQIQDYMNNWILFLYFSPSHVLKIKYHITMEGNAFILFKISFGVDSCPSLQQIKLFTV